ELAVHLRGHQWDRADWLVAALAGATSAADALARALCGSGSALPHLCRPSFRFDWWRHRSGPRARSGGSVADRLFGAGAARDVRKRRGNHGGLDALPGARSLHRAVDRARRGRQGRRSIPPSPRPAGHLHGRTAWSADLAGGSRAARPPPGARVV
ncbi:MAG: FIG00636845: hypothetical protein, partial [uncultured Sphingosinicella sp.]